MTPVAHRCDGDARRRRHRWRHRRRSRQPPPARPGFASRWSSEGSRRCVRRELRRSPASLRSVLAVLYRRRSPATVVLGGGPGLGSRRAIRSLYPRRTRPPCNRDRALATLSNSRARSTGSPWRGWSPPWRPSLSGGHGFPGHPGGSTYAYATLAERRGVGAVGTRREPDRSEDDVVGGSRRPATRLRCRPGGRGPWSPAVIDPSGA
jgi:hypothetical protein